MHNVLHAVGALHFQDLAHKNGIHHNLELTRVQQYFIKKGNKSLYSLKQIKKPQCPVTSAPCPLLLD